ncbi:hypothetical protein D8I24_2861 (plasmid) [Cupriavidus necator H850]|nr:hypothetical protein D8I24_2861 [Cupriavidus necator H850]
MCEAQPPSLNVYEASLGWELMQTRTRFCDPQPTSSGADVAHPHFKPTSI